MPLVSITRWTRIGLFNLLIVALYGLVMRYKIAFPFPYFDQKNLQHAHSHFAFAGWVSLLLMVLLLNTIDKNISPKEKQRFNTTLWAFLFCSWGMLIAFTVQGYGAISIFFATASVLVSFYYCWLFFQCTTNIKSLNAKPWFTAALFFNILSTLGTFYLSYMMATKSIDQHSYLATVYWYLHFQYNGWFFFSCVGLFIHYLQQKGISLKTAATIFWLLALSCVPAYGLSVLWLDLPIALLIIISIAAIAQFVAISKLLFFSIQKKTTQKLQLTTIGSLLLVFSGLSLFIKFGLQLGSTIPSVSKLAFGFRPIVIAYLHLVLLAFTTVFIIGYLYINNFTPRNKVFTCGILIFITGIFLNETILGIQGIASFVYYYIPYVNEALVVAAIILLLGMILLNLGYRNNRN